MEIKDGLEMDDIYKDIYAPPNFILDSGDKGSGKSRQQARIAYLQRKNGFKVLSNMVYKKYVVVDDAVTVEKVNPVGIFKVSTWAETFRHIAKFKESDYLKPVMLQLDEFHTYCYKWEYWDPQTTGFLKLVPLLRKLNLCVVGITASPHLVPKEFTIKEGGDCDWVVTKSRTFAKSLLNNKKYSSMPHIKDIRRKVDADMGSKERTPKEYVSEYLKRVSWVSDLSDPQSRHNYPVYSSGRFPYETVLEGEIIKNGRIEFQHLGAGVMKLGTRADNKTFNLHAIIDILSDELPEDVPSKIQEYLEGDGIAGKMDDTDYMVETLIRTSGKTKLKPGPKGYFLLTQLFPHLNTDQAQYIIKKARKRIKRNI